MSVLFFIPMVIIALYESFSPKKRWLDDFLNGPPPEDEDCPLARDPDVDGEDAENGLVISRVSFSELVKAFPNTQEVSSITLSNFLPDRLFFSQARPALSRKFIR